MTPEDEREAQYADQLVAELPQDERHRLLQAWAQYLVDREQADLPVRHRDFILGWIACYDSHELRPIRYFMTGPGDLARELATNDEARRRYVEMTMPPPASRQMVFGRPRPNTYTVSVGDQARNPEHAVDGYVVLPPEP